MEIVFIEEEYKKKNQQFYNTQR